MDNLLFNKYLAILSIDYQPEFTLIEPLPKDILIYLISIIYDFTKFKVFVGLNNTMIITNKGTYRAGDNILGYSFYKLTKTKALGSNIKKITFGINYSLILTHGGYAYMCGTFNLKTKNMTYVIDNIKDIIATDYYCAYVTNNHELYIQGSKIPNIILKNNETKDFISQPVKINITDVKEIVCLKNGLIF